MGALAKKGAVVLVRKTMKELKSATKKYETALREWRTIYKRMSEYKRYVRAKRTLQNNRERFGKLWWELPKDVQKELAHEFWSELDNVNEAFDQNGLPIRIGRQNIRRRI